MPPPGLTLGTGREWLTFNDLCLVTMVVYEGARMLADVSGLGNNDPLV